MNQKQKIQALLPGWNGKLLGHHICYLGNKHVHKALSYDPLNPKVVAKKIELMQADGYDGAIGTWQGPWAKENQQDAMMWSAFCSQIGMEWALLLDPGGMRKWGSGDPTVDAIAALRDPGTLVMLNARSYMREKFVLDFNTGANLQVLTRQFPGLKFCAQGKDFSWIAIPTNPDGSQITDSRLRNAAAVANLKQQNSSPTMVLPGICYSFCDAGKPMPDGVQLQSEFDAAGGVRDFTQSVWGGPARRLESFNGQFFIQQLAVTSSKAPFVCITSVDDCDEEHDRMKTMAECAGVDWTKL